MLQEAPVGAAAKAAADRTSRQMMRPGAQGRPAGGAPGAQPDQIPAPQPLQRLQNHLNMKQGAQDPVTQAPSGAASPPPTPAQQHPAAYGTPYDQEIAGLNMNDPDAIQELLGRMNQSIVTNQSELEVQDAAAAKGLPAPNQDRLGVSGANLGKQRNWVQKNQLA